MRKSIVFVVVSIMALASTNSMEAAYIYKNGTLINVEEVAEFSIEEHCNRGIQAIKDKKWDEAIKQFRIVTINFPEATLTQEAYYFLGVAYYHTSDYDLANQNFSIYLSKAQNSKYYLETLEHKFNIAMEFQKGAKKHLLNQQKLPSLFSDREEALKIYDEIIAAIPTHDLAMKSLLKKAQFLAENRSFSESITTLQSLIRKFPKTETACESYLQIATILLEQAKLETNNPDLLPLARINLKKFESDFPQATKELAEAKKSFTSMQEVYADGLYDLGAFYERKGEPRAACIYYMQAVRDFPETPVSQKCKKRLQALDVYAKSFQSQ